jgi:hypothetical protein
MWIELHEDLTFDDDNELRSYHFDATTALVRIRFRNAHTGTAQEVTIPRKHWLQFRDTVEVLIDRVDYVKHQVPDAILHLEADDADG